MLGDDLSNLSCNETLTTLTSARVDKNSEIRDALKHIPKGNPYQLPPFDC